MDGRTVLVTGANSGIGFETAAALASQGAQVIITSRDPGRGESAARRIRERSNRTVEVMELDLARLASVREFARALTDRYDRLHVLVNNAGATHSLRSLTEDGYERTFQVNHLGPFLLTSLLGDLLRASAPARIVNVASTAHRQAGSFDFDDIHSERGYVGLRVYAKSKLANILFTRELARRLEGTGVTANAVHPGTVRSGFGMDGDARGFLRVGMMIARPFFLSASRGARTPIYLASSPEVEGRSGEYWVRCRASTPSKGARDDDAARRLWELSAELTGTTP